MDQEIIPKESEEPGRYIKGIKVNKLLYRYKFGEVINYTGHVKDWNLQPQMVVLKVETMIDEKTMQKAIKAAAQINGIYLCFLLQFSTY